MRLATSFSPHSIQKNEQISRRNQNAQFDNSIRVRILPVFVNENTESVAFARWSMISKHGNMKYHFILFHFHRGGVIAKLRAKRKIGCHNDPEKHKIIVNVFGSLKKHKIVPISVNHATSKHHDATHLLNPIILIAVSTKCDTKIPPQGIDP